MKKTKEQINRETKEYYKNNPEIYQRHLEICRKWYHKNREKDKIDGYIWRMTNRDKVRGTEKKWRLLNKNKIVEKGKKERINNPIDVKARSMVKNAGIIKAESCQICGSKDGLELHHFRYDKPLLVNTLCKQCHTIQHVKNFPIWQEARLLADQHLEVAS